MAVSDEIYRGPRHIYQITRATERDDCFASSKHRFRHAGLLFVVAGALEIRIHRGAGETPGSYTGPDLDMHEAPYAARAVSPEVCSTSRATAVPFVSLCIQPRRADFLRTSALAPIADALVVQDEGAPFERYLKRVRHNKLRSDGRYLAGDERQLREQHAMSVVIEGLPEDA